MNSICGCPLGAALPDVTISECKDNLGQIQKIIFQRLYKTPGVLNENTKADLTTLETITPKFAAVDGTKMVISPFINNPSNEAGKAKTFGGGNQTVGGVPIVIGRDPSPFTSVMYKEHQKTISQMKQLQCEDALGVYLVTENGAIACLVDDHEASEESKKYRPIPIRQLFIGDKSLGGFDGPDGNELSFHFLPNWSDNLVQLQPEYDPLTQLVNGKGV